MLSQTEKSYCLALQELQNKNYEAADRAFGQVADTRALDKEFAVLREVTMLLLETKKELARIDGDHGLEIEETFSRG